MNIRASIGTANRLGLTNGKNNVEPTTAYLLLERGCAGKCVFCPQSFGDNEHVSRVVWLEYDLSDIVERLNDSEFEWICLQTAVYPKLEDDLAVVLSSISRDIPISVAVSPLSQIEPFKLAEAGVDRIGIPVDGATKSIVEWSKGYSSTEWEEFFDYLFTAIEVFGKEKVSTHIIVGLGETDKELSLAFKSFKSIGVNVALFALTPPDKSDLEKPDMISYRKAQFMCDLLIDNNGTLDSLNFDNDGTLLGTTDSNLENIEWNLESALLTRGCPDCNRPFYNEPVSGPWYNYPRKLTKDEVRAESVRISDGLGKR